MDTTPAISVNGLVKNYGDLAVLKGLSFTVARGETYALLGPNGAGKSTTVEILEGYRPRDGGTIEVLGVDPRHGKADWRSRIGIVLQEAHDASLLTVDELVRHVATFHPNPRDPDEVVRLVGLEAKRKARSGKLSGGQRRRLDVALGIVGRPELLFLDEPTTGFDPEARRSFWELIRMLQGEGTSIVLTTHYLEEAQVLADRIGIVNGGVLAAEGTAAQLTAPFRPRVHWIEDGQPRSQETDTPTALVWQLSAQGQLEVPGLEIVRPSLEEVYLSLIGTGQASRAQTQEVAA